MKLKKLLILVLLVLAGKLGAGAAHNFDNETLRYRVLFKWGLINKTAGYATLRMLPGGGEMCTAELIAASEPWADKFYRVRDTLTSEMYRADFTPRYYEKKAHEGNDRKHDIVRFAQRQYHQGRLCAQGVEERRTHQGRDPHASGGRCHGRHDVVVLPHAQSALRPLEEGSHRHA